MMGKSSRHKAQNVHHFVTFSERILKVNTDVIHQLRRVDHESDDTFFGEALLKWTDLDLTDHFVNFKKEIQSQVQTFEQLVHYKDNILASLKKHLAVSGSLAVNALLDLLVQLARDLQQDFVPHFYDFFTILVNLLAAHSKNADILEQVFQTLAFLFRFLWRYLVKDFTTVFRYFSQLLQSSQKDYIMVFAAESCAYLLRKVKHQDQLLNVLLGSLKTDQELVNGIGLLLFEMMKGVKHHFHTISIKVFPLILQKLGPWNPHGIKEPDLPYHLVENAVTLLMQECAEHTTKEHCKSLWEMLLGVISEVSSACIQNQTPEESGCDDSSGLVQHLCRLLRLVSVWLTHNSGSIVSNAEDIAETLCSILKSPCHTAILSTDLLMTVSKLLMTCQGRLSADMIAQLNSLVFLVPVKFSTLKSFVASLQNLSFFEKDTLPRLMNRLHSTLPLEDTDQKHEVLAFMTELVMLKIKSPVTGDDLLKTFCLDRSLSRNLRENSFSVYIDSILVDTLEQDKSLSASDLSVLWGAIVCSTHWSTSDLQNKSSLWKQLMVRLKCCEDDVLLEIILALLNQLLRSILTIFLDHKMDILPVEYEDICDILRLRPFSQFSLQMMDFYLSCPQNSSLLTEQELIRIYALLEPNLVSPSHNIRLITCHILSIYLMDLPIHVDGLTRESAFKIMFEAEKLVPSVHNYREKLIHLRKLDYDVIVKCLPSKVFIKAPLLFLLGNEFWNFKLMWEPLSDIIASHAHGLDTEDFWEVMFGQMKKASITAERELGIKEPSSDCIVHSAILKLLRNHMSQFLADTRQPDFTNFRIQLWRALKKFPDKCILRSDELCELYLNFLKNEFFVADEDSKSYQNIRDCTTSTALHRTETDSVLMDWQAEEPMDIQNENNEDNEQEQPSVAHAGRAKKIVKPRKATIKSLLVHLDLFATFKKQRSMFNKPEVQNTFYDLLKHRHSSVQKAAFECVLSYKNPHIMPYRENFIRLLDDKTFKSEIVLFRVDEESTEVKDSDREELIPVLMRILFGKFHGKAGNDTSGTSRSNLRRAIIFGFLCGCKSEELLYFLELLFQPFMHFVTDDPVNLVSSIQADVILEKFIPLKRIKGVLNTVLSVSKKLGNRLKNFAHSLLHILLGLTTTVGAALIQRKVLQKGVVNLLKALYHTTVNRITQFFASFEDLDYTSNEIEAVFNAVVWPQAQKLAFEGIHHPTPILKLFLLWSRSKRFSPLLGYIKDSAHTSYTPLTAIFSLLNAPKLSPSVAAAIMDLINNLLEETEDNDDLQNPPPLPSPFAPFNELEQETNGKNLLLCHISSLLAYLQSALSRVSKGRQIFNVELKILARISRFVTTQKECHSLCDLLILFFAQETNLSQDMEENVLLSLTNLIQYIDQPETFYRTVSQLFCTVERRESRLLLCRLFRVISEKNTGLITVVNYIDKLNAWDRRKAEEPDYFVRLEAFGEINTMFLNRDMINIDALLPVVYNCCHFINNVDDLSLRDNATHCLINIVTKVATAAPDCSKTFNIVIEKTLVPQVKLGMRNKSETVRHEFLAILQSLVNNCPHHQMFTGLKDLCDKDPEADFFENIRHIQIHKRSRALRRLYKHLKDHHFRAEIHMSYFIPLVYAFIIDHTYSKYASLQDAAVDLLGAICKQLPWQYYLQLLRFYLYSLPKKVELQRQLVRVVVTLLDAFRFDLRNSKYTTNITPEAVSGSFLDTDEDFQVTKSTHPEEPMTISTHPQEQMTVSAHPQEQMTISTHPQEQSTVSTHPQELTIISTPPQENSTISTHPQKQMNILTHPQEQTTISADPQDVLLPVHDGGTQSQNDKTGEGNAEQNFNKPGESENTLEMIPPVFAGINSDEVENADGNTVDVASIICSSAAATRIHKTIVVSLLPQLHSIVTQKAKSEGEHKLVKSKYPEDEEILRVPVALAMIKLLQNLPAGSLENMLPGILLKICAFLRSRSRDVRSTARDTLEKTALSLGARFLPFILRELKATLTRGYQLHVLSYTAYRLLKVLSAVLKPGDLNPALAVVQEVVYSELFGHIADEKEVAAIKAKYFEAQFIKGYDVYKLLAKFISPSCLDQLLQPVRGVLECTHNRRQANKAETVLVKVAHGLMGNDGIPIETMMVFINSLIVQQINDTDEQNWQKLKEKTKEKIHHSLPESCLLLPQVVPRGGFKPKASKKTNIHVLVEFGLQLLNMCLKKSLLLPSEHMHLQLLNPLMPAIRDCLNSSHVKTSANSMRCLSWLLKFALPSLKENISKIVQGMFVVLQNYAGASTAKGGNQELISMCFKAVTVLVRDVPYYEITENQLQVLLTYCEEDLYNYSRQSSAFNLIRAILSRKLDTPQLHQVIDRLFEMSVTAKSTSVRLQSRQVILFYLLNYPVGKNLKKYLYFYLDNLNYELEEGRESTLEMMISMFSAFPQKILNNHCPRFFVVLAMASFNDTSAKCRKLIFVALRTLIGKIDLKRRKTLFANVVTWMKSDVIDVRTMGCHVCGIFVEVEGGKFEFYLKEIIPLLQQQLNPDRYKGNDEDAMKTEQEDMCLLAVLNTFMKTVRELCIVRRDDLTEELNEIWDHIQHHLTYPHSQVRLVSSQLVGLLFSAWEPTEIAEQSLKSEEASDCTMCQQSSYMLQDTVQLVQNFSKALCQQLQTPHLDDILGTQVVKNMLYLARLTEALGRLDALALIAKRVMKEANMEVIHNVKITLKRSYAFKWAAAVGVSLSPESVQSVLLYLLPPLQREMLTQTQDEGLRNLAQEVADLLKKQVGVPAFTEAFASCHKWRLEKRAVKKSLVAAEAVTDPDIAARKKIRHNLKKREAVKRKIEQKRPTKRIKKNKLSILNVAVDDVE